MELKKKEVADGLKWMMCAGAFGVLLTIFLAYADRELRHSPRERELGETLRELRTAQSALTSGTIEGRQLGPEGAVPHVASSHEEHPSH